MVEVNVWDQFYMEKFKENVDSDMLWLPIEDTPYKMWVTDIVCAICNSFSRECFLNIIQSLCRIKVSLGLAVPLNYSRKIECKSTFVKFGVEPL